MVNKLYSQQRLIFKQKTQLFKYKKNSNSHIHHRRWFHTEIRTHQAKLNVRLSGGIPNSRIKITAYFGSKSPIRCRKCSFLPRLVKVFRTTLQKWDKVAGLICWSTYELLEDCLVCPIFRYRISSGLWSLSTLRNLRTGCLRYQWRTGGVLISARLWICNKTFFKNK